MVSQGARQLILVGRSEMPPRTHWDTAAKENPRLAAQVNAIRELEHAGARVLVAAADVSQPSAIVDLLSRAEAEGWPPVRGVVHAAHLSILFFVKKMEIVSPSI